MFYRTLVIADRSFTLRGNNSFRPFCFGDLDLDPMTFVYELDPYHVEIYRVCENELRTKVIVWQTYTHTDRRTNRHTTALLSRIGRAIATFLNFYVSHCSTTKLLRNDAKYYTYVVDNSCLFPTVKGFSKSINNWWSYCKSSSPAFYETHSTDNMKIINYCRDAFCSNLPLHRRTDNSVKKFTHCDNVLVKSVLHVERCSLCGICSV